MSQSNALNRPAITAPSVIIDTGIVVEANYRVPPGCSVVDQLYLDPRRSYGRPLGIRVSFEEGLTNHPSVIAPAGVGVVSCGDDD